LPSETEPAYAETDYETPLSVLKMEKERNFLYKIKVN